MTVVVEALFVYLTKVKQHEKMHKKYANFRLRLQSSSGVRGMRGMREGRRERGEGRDGTKTETKERKKKTKERERERGREGERERERERERETEQKTVQGARRPMNHETLLKCLSRSR